MNKYCATCTLYSLKNFEAPKHECYCNYNGPATAMEAEIVARAFSRSILLHKLKYLKLLGMNEVFTFKFFSLRYDRLYDKNEIIVIRYSWER